MTPVSIMRFDFKPYLFVLFVVASLLLFYTAYDKQTKTLQFEKLVKLFSFQDAQYSFRELNKVAALAAIGLISIVFIFGPLSRLWPNVFARYLVYRKPVGLTGFGLALVHAIYSAWEFYGFDMTKMFSSPSFLALVSGIIALFIFFLMTITSTQNALRYIGYKKWKALQTCGYIALLFAIAHFFIIESKPATGFDVRPYGLLFFYLAIAALILRLLIILVKAPERKRYEEHFGDV